MRVPSTSADRGQAFTLEGVVSGLVLLVAVLLVMQTAVITPNTGGTSGDRAERLQDQREAKDALIVAAHNESSPDEPGNLSELVRNFDPTPGIGSWCERGTRAAECANGSTMGTALGDILDDRMGNSGYDIELVYRNESGGVGTITLVDLSSPNDGEVTASYSVTLFNEDYLTSEDYNETSIEDAYNENWDPRNEQYPIPPGEGLDDSPVYNVVEVRLTWDR